MVVSFLCLSFSRVPTGTALRRGHEATPNRLVLAYGCTDQLRADVQTLCRRRTLKERSDLGPNVD